MATNDAQDDSTTNPVGADPRRNQLVQTIRPDDPSTWELAWKLNITPWDKRGGVPHPALCEAVETSGIDFPKGVDKRALVPGCGSGHDAVYLATALGLHVTGIDISPTAIERAISLSDSSSSDALATDRVVFKVEDFLKMTPETDAEKFDLIYDFTFFCAIHPSQRIHWGQQMATLIKSGGFLIAVVFPIEPKKETGPPWYLRPDHYDEPLGGHFKKVLDRVPSRVPPGWPDQNVMQHLLVWQKI